MVLLEACLNGCFYLFLVTVLPVVSTESASVLAPDCTIEGSYRGVPRVVYSGRVPSGHLLKSYFSQF